MSSQAASVSAILALVTGRLSSSWGYAIAAASSESQAAVRAGRLEDVRGVDVPLDVLRDAIGVQGGERPLLHVVVEGDLGHEGRLVELRCRLIFGLAPRVRVGEIRCRSLGIDSSGDRLLQHARLAAGMDLAQALVAGAPSPMGLPAAASAAPATMLRRERPPHRRRTRLAALGPQIVELVSQTRGADLRQWYLARVRRVAQAICGKLGVDPVDPLHGQPYDEKDDPDDGGDP